MKRLMLTVLFILCACDGQSPPPARIAEPQREALEKAQGVEQTLQQSSEAAQKKIDQAEEK